MLRVRKAQEHRQDELRRTFVNCVRRLDALPEWSTGKLTVLAARAGRGHDLPQAVPSHLFKTREDHVCHVEMMALARVLTEEERQRRRGTGPKGDRAVRGHHPLVYGGQLSPDSSGEVACCPAQI